MPFDTVLVLYCGLGHSNFIQIFRVIREYSKLSLNKIHLLKSVVISVSNDKINH